MRLSPGCVPLNYQILNVQWVKSLKETQVTFLTQRFLKCWTRLFIHEADATPINWVSIFLDNLSQGFSTLAPKNP